MYLLLSPPFSTLCSDFLCNCLGRRQLVTNNCLVLTISTVFGTDLWTIRRVFFSSSISSFFPLTRAKRCHSPWMGRLNTSEHEQTRDPPTSKQATSPVANCHDGAHSGLRASSNTPDSAVPIEINATLETAGTSGRKMANASPKYRETKFVHGGPSMVELAQDGPNDTAFLLPPWAVHTHTLSLSYEL